MQELGAGLIGTRFMGKAHALAFGAVRAVMGGAWNQRHDLL